MTGLRLTIGRFTFDGRFEDVLAPKTCAAFRARLPLVRKVIHVRWSGEALWMPLGDHDYGVGLENATSHPAPGQILFHPADASETEFLIPYGATLFASKVGQLAGSHFVTLTSGLEHLPEAGRLALWEGAQDVRLELAG